MYTDIFFSGAKKLSADRLSFIYASYLIEASFDCSGPIDIETPLSPYPLT